MSHSRSPIAYIMKAVAVRANDFLLIACILVLGVVAMAGTVGLSRVERAYQIAARV